MNLTKKAAAVVAMVEVLSGCATWHEIKNSKIGQAAGGLGIAIGDTTKDAVQKGDKKLSGWIKGTQNESFSKEDVKKSQQAYNEQNCGGTDGGKLDIDGIMGPDFEHAAQLIRDVNFGVTFSNPMTAAEIRAAQPCNKGPMSKSDSKILGYALQANLN